MLQKKMVSVYIDEAVVTEIDKQKGCFTRSSFVASLLLKHLYKKGNKKLQVTDNN